MNESVKNREREKQRDRAKDRERARKRERDTEREREREREREKERARWTRESKIVIYRSYINSYIYILSTTGCTSRLDSSVSFRCWLSPTYPTAKQPGFCSCNSIPILLWSPGIKLQGQLLSCKCGFREWSFLQSTSDCRVDGSPRAC